MLTDDEKRAFRHLLYRAMLDIRGFCQSRGTESINPLEWRRQYRDARYAGGVADWLHNLALYSEEDFKGFNVDYFWREHASYCSYFPRLTYYKELFDNYLKELQARGDKKPVLGTISTTMTNEPETLGEPCDKFDAIAERVSSSNVPVVVTTHRGIEIKIIPVPKPVRFMADGRPVYRSEDLQYLVPDHPWLIE